MAVIRQKTTVFNQPVGVVKTNVNSQSVGETIGRAANVIQKTIFQQASIDAEKKGIDFAKSLDASNFRTTNPETGQTEEFKPPPPPPEGFGSIAAQAYQNVIDQRYENSIVNEIKIKAQEISLKYQFDPDSYGEVMQEYIADMAKGTIGKYQEFVRESGKNYLASTQLNIKERVSQRARTNAADSISNSLTQNSEEAFTLGLSGAYLNKDNPADAIIASQVSNSRNGVSSGLIKIGSEDIAKDTMYKAISIGAVEHLLNNTNSPEERNLLNLAIRTRGQNVSALSSDMKFKVNAVLKYALNLKPSDFESLLGHVATVSTDHNAVDRDMAALKKVQLKQQNKKFELTAGSPTFDPTKFAVAAFGNSTGNVAQDLSIITANVEIASEKYSDDLTNLKRRYQSDADYTDVELQADTKELRNKYLRPWLIQVAADGNIKELRTYVTSGLIEDSVNLTSRQLRAVASLQESGLFNLNEDRGFVREVLLSSLNEVKLSRDEEIRKFELGVLVEEAIFSFSNSAHSESGDNINLINELKSKIASAVGGDISNTEANAFISSINQAIGRKDVQTFSSYSDSTGMGGLSLYIQSNGNIKPKGESPTNNLIKDVGQKILNSVPVEDRSSVLSLISSIQTKMSQNETNKAASVVKQKILDSVLSGTGDPNLLSHRKASQEIADEKGIVYENYVSMSDDKKRSAISLAISAPPTSLINQLNQIASGGQVKNPTSLLNVFSIVSNHTSDTGVLTNRFLSSLSDTTVEFLRDVNRIRIQQEEALLPNGQPDVEENNRNLIDISMKLRKSQTDSVSQTRTLFGTKSNKNRSADNFVSDLYEDALLGAELGPVAEYHAVNGMTLKEITERLDQIVESRYAVTKFVRDPRLPAGDIKRSRFSLEAVFPNDEDRIAFTAAIETQLPLEYSLFALDNAKARAMSFTGLFEEVDPDTPENQKQVYLVPNENSGVVQYYAHFVDNDGQLKPLIIRSEGKDPVFPLFDIDDIKDHLETKRVREDAELNESVDDAERVLNRRREIGTTNWLSLF